MYQSAKATIFLNKRQFGTRHATPMILKAANNDASYISVVLTRSKFVFIAGTLASSFYRAIVSWFEILDRHTHTTICGLQGPTFQIVPGYRSSLEAERPPASPIRAPPLGGAFKNRFLCFEVKYLRDWKYPRPSLRSDFPFTSPVICPYSACAFSSQVAPGPKRKKASLLWLCVTSKLPIMRHRAALSAALYIFFTQ
jgi:hypothetical protein